MKLLDAGYTAGCHYFSKSLTKLKKFPTTSAFARGVYSRSQISFHSKLETKSFSRKSFQPVVKISDHSAGGRCLLTSLQLVVAAVS